MAQKKTYGAAQFKEQCLAILDSLGPEGVIITKRGKPVAKVLPLGAEPNAMIGALRGKIRVKGDLLSTGVAWDADAES